MAMGNKTRIRKCTQWALQGRRVKGWHLLVKCYMLHVLTHDNSSPRSNSGTAENANRNREGYDVLGRKKSVYSHFIIHVTWADLVQNLGQRHLELQ